MVKISALGPLKTNIPEETTLALKNDSTSVFDFIEEHFGIPRNEARMSFNINGRMQRGNYILKSGDNVVVFKMGGAG